MEKFTLIVDEVNKTDQLIIHYFKNHILLKSIKLNVLTILLSSVQSISYNVSDDVSLTISV